MKQTSSISETSFSSTYELQRLYKTEITFSRDLHEYASQLKRHIDTVNTYLAKAYPDGPLDGTVNAETYVSNPLNALGMMWRENVSKTASYTRSIILHGQQTTPSN